MCHQSDTAAQMNDAWSNFFIAQVGATAALSGLVIVAISLNISRILAFPSLPGRGAETLILLVGSLIVCSLMLIPQPARLKGVEVGAISALLWVLPTVMQVRSYDRADPKRWALARVMVVQGAVVPMFVGGALLSFGDGSGLYWLAAGILFGIAGAMMNTWVLLIEILR